MPSSQYPAATAYEPVTNAHTNNHHNYIAQQRNHMFANRPAKKSIIQRTSAAQSIPSTSPLLQYSTHTHSPATVQVQHNPYQQQPQHHYAPIVNQPTIAQQFSNAVDEYLLHGEMPLPQDQTYIMSNEAPNIVTNSVEPDYLT